MPKIYTFWVLNYSIIHYSALWITIIDNFLATILGDLDDEDDDEEQDNVILDVVTHIGWVWWMKYCSEQWMERWRHRGT